MKRLPLRLLSWTLVLMAGATSVATLGCKEAKESFDLELGQSSYLAHCAACHGNEGAGDGPAAGMIAANHGVAPPSLGADGPAANRSRKRLGEIITKGGRHSGMSDMMPPWGDYLEPRVVDAVTNYVLLLSSGVEVETPDYGSTPLGGDPEARMLYVYYCSSCHGPQGRGDGTVSPGGAVRPRDLTQRAYFATKSDDDLYSAIALGGEHAGESALMPGWTYELEPRQIRLLVEYIRTISNTASSK